MTTFPALDVVQGLTTTKGLSVNITHGLDLNFKIYYITKDFIGQSSRTKVGSIFIMIFKMLEGILTQ